MHAIHRLARGGLALVVFAAIAALPGGSLLLLSPRVRQAAFGARTISGRLAALRIVLVRLRLILPLALLSGCQLSPSLPVLGAFFPDWLFCMLFALFVAVLTDAALAAAGWRRQFEHWTLVAGYGALAVAAALLSWLALFRN